MTGVQGAPARRAGGGREEAAPRRRRRFLVAIDGKGVLLHERICSFGEVLVSDAGPEQVQHPTCKQHVCCACIGGQATPGGELPQIGEQHIWLPISQEIGVLQKVSYDRNIVQYYGACLTAEQPMLIMEFCAVRRSPILGWKNMVHRNF